MKRRRFLRFVAITPLAVYSGMGCATKKTRGSKQGAAQGALAPRPCRVRQREKGPGRVLNGAQWSALEAACERIYPGDDGSAGAKAANVVNFIDAQLTMPPVDAFAPLLKVGAMQLDRLAKREGKRYADLPASRQDALLKRIQVGRLGRYSGRRFVRILLSLTLEGVFGDPIYGGNRDQRGWKSIGFVAQSPGPRCPWGGVGDAGGGA